MVDIKEEWITCDKCGSQINRNFILRHQSGKEFCLKCKLIVSGIDPNDLKPLSKEKFDKVLETFANTPPLKYKELKERLKKEQEKKKRSSENKRNS